jgi:hypothetical protein
MNIYEKTTITQEMIDSFEPCRLYIKELSGILYFGKTKQEDAEKYSGSGVKWKDRIKKYGKKNIKTLWLSDIYTDPFIIHEVAIHFSKENDIVNSDKWANLKTETGLDGGSTKGHKKSKESVQKRSGENHPNKKLSVRTKIKNSKIGVSLSQSHRDNIGKGSKNHTRSRDKTVYQFENI